MKTALRLATAMIACGAALSAWALRPVNPQHVIVHAESGKFCGWPANEGIWVWGDEIVVGFDIADYEFHDDTHSFRPPAFTRLARSIDGGVSWQLDPALHFDAGQGGESGYVNVRNQGIAQLCTVITVNARNTNPIYYSLDAGNPNYLAVTNPALQGDASNGGDLDGGSWFYQHEAAANINWSLFE